MEEKKTELLKDILVKALTPKEYKIFEFLLKNDKKDNFEKTAIDKFKINYDTLLNVKTKMDKAREIINPINKTKITFDEVYDKVCNSLADYNFTKEENIGRTELIEDANTGIRYGVQFAVVNNYKKTTLNIFIFFGEIEINDKTREIINRFNAINSFEGKSAFVTKYQNNNYDLLVSIPSHPNTVQDCFESIADLLLDSIKKYIHFFAEIKKYFKYDKNLQLMN